MCGGVCGCGADVGVGVWMVLMCGWGGLSQGPGVGLNGEEGPP